MNLLGKGIHGQNTLRKFFAFFTERTIIMQDILKEYGPAIITVIAIVALIGLISFLIGHDGSSIVGQAFSSLITNFFNSAGKAVPKVSGAAIRFF